MKKMWFVLVFASFANVASAQITLPYSQDFEGAPFVPTGWQTFPIGSPINWIHDTTASGYGMGAACTSFDNYTTAAGSYYGIRLPSMNFTGVTNPYIRFDIAYAQRTGTGSDVFGIWWSNNGTSNWQNVVNYSGNTLTTAPATSALFTPTSGQWQTKIRSLASLAGLPFVRLAIEDDCNHGNKIYFDNVHVYDSTLVGVQEIFSSEQASIGPNPFRDFIRINITIPHSIIKAELYNMLGALAGTLEEVYSGFQLENISGLPNGIYALKIYTKDGDILCNKLIKQ